MSSPVSLKKIAQEAGVSVMTASRALNGTGAVASATAERIRAIAERYKYRPNLLIRGVQTGRTMNVGVILPAELGFYTRVLEGIHNELLDQRYSIQLSLIKADLGEEAIRQEHEQILRLLDLRVDGILLRPVNDHASDLYFKEVFERRVPLVTLDRRLEKAHCDFVGSNDAAAGKQAAQFLIDRGHRHILLVATGDMVSTGRDRRDGFMACARKHPNVEVTVINEQDFHYHEEDAELALREHPSITAAFCINDLLAAGLYRTAAKHGLRIPDDLSVLGFGNLELSEFLTPPLSTFDQHPVKLGHAAAQRLIERMRADPSSEPPAKTVIAADPIHRGSIRQLALCLCTLLLIF